MLENASFLNFLFNMLIIVNFSTNISVTDENQRTTEKGEYK